MISDGLKIENKKVLNLHLIFFIIRSVGLVTFIQYSFACITMIVPRLSKRLSLLIDYLLIEVDMFSIGIGVS